MSRNPASRLVDTVAELIGGLALLGLVTMLVLTLIQSFSALVGLGSKEQLGRWLIGMVVFGLLFWLAKSFRERRRWARYGMILYCGAIAVFHAVSAPWGLISFVLAGVAAVVAALLAGPSVGREYQRPAA